VGRTLLLEGRPGVGKTTVIKKVVERLGDRAGGFYTEEIRDQRGRREGFRLVTLNGDQAVMAHTELRGGDRPRVSRYGVNLEVLKQVGVAALRRAMRSEQVVIIDEIGKMELFSDAFRSAVSDAVAGGYPVLATVMSGSQPWVDETKMKGDVEVWTVTPGNRDVLPGRVCEWLGVDAEAK